MYVITRDIKNHIFLINNAFNLNNGNIESIKSGYENAYRGFLNYANCNFQNRILFASANFDLLYEEYNKRIEMAVKIINLCADDDLEKIICTLEYMRFMVTYEFVCADGEKSEKNISNSAHTFSGSGLSAALTGRGICQSQASFCRDILNRLGIEARFLAVSSKNGSHADVLVDETGVVDPTNYNGSKESIAGGHLFYEYKLERYNNFSFVDNQKFNKCTTNIQKTLIEYLLIDKISTTLDLDSKSNDEKQFIIWTLLAKNLTPMDKPINSYTVGINDYEVEITNLLELFYRANNIPIQRKMTVDGKFKNEGYTVFETIINNEKVCIIPRIIISMAKNMRGSISPISYSEDLTQYNIHQEEVIKAKKFLDENYWRLSELELEKKESRKR